MKVQKANWDSATITEKVEWLFSYTDQNGKDQSFDVTATEEHVRVEGSRLEEVNLCTNVTAYRIYKIN